MFGSKYDTEADPAADKWAARASEWEKKIAVGRRRLDQSATDGLMDLPDDVGGGVHALHSINRMRNNNVLGQGILGQGGTAIDIDTRKAMKTEIELMLSDRLRTITNDIRDTIEKEWRTKLPEVEYNIKEQNSELKEKFEQDHRLILNVGDKLIETTSQMETLKKDTRAVEMWKRDTDTKIREAYESLGEIREKDNMTRKHCEDLIKSREEVSSELQEVIRVKEDTRAAESRLENYIRDESRNVEKRIQLSIDGMDAKLHRLNAHLSEDSEASRLMASKIMTSDESITLLKKDISKQKSKLQKYSAELDDQGDEIDEIRSEVKLMLQTTSPGYCQGCRVLMNDVDSKLFQIKESICCLDKTMTEINPKGNTNTNPRETTKLEPSVSPETIQSLQNSVKELGEKTDFIVQDMTLLKEVIQDLQQTHLSQQQNSSSEEVPEAIMRYVDDIAARIQGVVLSDVRDTLDHWGTSTARQTDVDDMKLNIDDMMKRMDRLDDY